MGSRTPLSRRPRRLLATAVLLCAAAGCATRGGAGRTGVRADAVEPAHAVATSGGHLVVYEIEVRNTGDAPAAIERMVRRRSDRAGEESFEGPHLLRRTVARVRRDGRGGRAELPPGARAVVLLDAAVADGAAVPRFEHDLTVSGAGESGAEIREVVTATEAAPSEEPAIVLAPPLAGDRWLCENGPATLSGHRCAVVWLGMRPRAAQRFAMDFFRADAERRTHGGDPRRNESYLAFGAEVLAVADARVVAAADGIPDNVPDPAERAVEMSGATVAGNHVVLDLGGGRFALYAHLRQGSVTVRPGDAVRTGQVVGRLGNSGNSTEPHLHFHVADGPSPVDASGRPFVFASFRETGRGAGAVPVQRSASLPAEGAVVDFGR